MLGTVQNTLSRLLLIKHPLRQVQLHLHFADGEIKGQRDSVLSQGLTVGLGRSRSQLVWNEITAGLGRSGSQLV